MDPRLMSVPEAGEKFFGIGRSASYEAARRGQIPTMEVGKRKFALVKKIERDLDGDNGERDLG